MRFIRYGSLKPQPHKPSTEWFHSPPASSGFYAFPVGYVEEFLLGGKGEGSIQNNRYRYLRDEFGKKIATQPEKLYRVVKEGYSDERFNWHEEVREFMPEYRYLAKNYDIRRVYRWWGDKDRLSEPFPPDDVDDNSDEWDIRRKEIHERATNFVEELKPNYFNYDGEIWFHGLEVIPLNERLRTYGEWCLVDIKTYKKGLKKMTDRHKFMRYQQLIVKEGRPGGFPLGSKDNFEVFIEKLK